MTSLIAIISSGKGTWKTVYQLIEKGKWDKVYIITNKFGEENFSKKENIKFIVIDDNKTYKQIISQIETNLKESLNDIEVALNISSGQGKEHMALLVALLRTGMGIRFVDIVDDKIEELSILDNPFENEGNQ
jgi:hypothetical protein